MTRRFQAPSYIGILYNILELALMWFGLISGRSISIFRIIDRMLGILKVKMSLEYPTFETAFESGLVTCTVKFVCNAH